MAKVEGRAPRLLVLLASVITILTTSLAPANAMDLVSADPEVNSTTASAPSAVTLTFSSEISEPGSSMNVRAPSGSAVDDGSLLIDGAQALIGLKRLNESGRYNVTYQFMSVNGEILSGSYSFTFDAPADVSTPSPAPTASPSEVENQAVPGEANGQGSLGTDVFMISLLVISFLVLIFIARSLRNSKPKKRKKK